MKRLVAYCLLALAPAAVLALPVLGAAADPEPRGLYTTIGDKDRRVELRVSANGTSATAAVYCNRAKAASFPRFAIKAGRFAATQKRRGRVVARLTGRFTSASQAALAVTARGSCLAEGSKLTLYRTGSADAQLAAVKVATARYASVERALADGYIVGSPCEATPAGGMGHHYPNPALMADNTLDPLRPEILLYAPRPDGTRELIGVEYWKRDDDGNPATVGDRPSLFGQPFDGPMPGHTPVMPMHYDLHVWIWRANPTGMFAQWNPDVRCPG